ncbi:hypothetical protein CK203_053378 [Vitis vinifera]|uniref:Uncharacterized protein n=1 Tax=Vitis vinifera TaxID=29760 RepID=A0A438GZM8_VITVI|nr:hypothetical protein CK203_053378 [Vitis vinifera]
MPFPPWSGTSCANLTLITPNCDSSRPNFVAENDGFKRLSAYGFLMRTAHGGGCQQIKKSNYFSFSRLSFVFWKDSKGLESDNVSGSLVKRMSSSTGQKMGTDTIGAATLSMKSERSIKDVMGISVQNLGNYNRGGGFSHSFSGNLRYPRRRCVSSCP